MEHILLKKMHKYSVPKKEDIIPGYEYDEIKGYWKNVLNDFPLVFDAVSVGPRTKKEDVETGEDKKSE